MEGDLDGVDYKKIKAEAEEKERRLEAKLTDVMEQHKNRLDIDRLLDSSIGVLIEPDKICGKADIEKKRMMVGSIFSEKLCFDQNKY